MSTSENIGDTKVFKVVEGNFKKNKEPEELKTLGEYLDDMGFLKVKPEMFILLMEADDRVFTITNPIMSLSEIVGGMDIHKQQLVFMSAMGEVRDGE